MRTDITAKARVGGRGQRELKGVIANVCLPLWVELDLYADGAYALRRLKGSEDRRVVQFSLDTVEAAIDEKFDEDDLAEVYSEAMALDLDPDATIEAGEDDDEEYGDDE